MARNPNEERHRQVAEYLASAPDEERGAIVVALLGHALIYLTLIGADTVWAGFAVTRVWRRRDAGLTEALRTGVHKPTLAALLLAHLGVELLRRFGVKLLDDRSAASR